MKSEISKSYALERNASVEDLHCCKFSMYLFSIHDQNLKVHMAEHFVRSTCTFQNSVFSTFKPENQ